ncbi:MAG: hypothetical protein ACLTYN_00050 [Dysosmobacter welbionis]
MNKRVWIWNHYAGSMYEEQGGRHYAFAKYLRQAGYEPVVFCCNARHGKAETYFQTRPSGRCMWPVRPMCPLSLFGGAPMRETENSGS